MDTEFGAVEAGTDIEGVIEMKAGMNQGTVHEFNLKVSRYRCTFLFGVL